MKICVDDEDQLLAVLAYECLLRICFNSAMMGHNLLGCSWGASLIHIADYISYNPWMEVKHTVAKLHWSSPVKSDFANRNLNLMQW